MPKLVKAGETDFTRALVVFHLVGPDGITPATGEAGGQPQWSNNGGSWATSNLGTLTHIGNGRYFAQFTSAGVFVLGQSLYTRYKSANTAECPGTEFQVVGFDPNALEQEIARIVRPNKVVWYVRTDGNDANDGLTPYTAKLSPKTVIEAAASGDVVLLGAGTFALGAAVINVPAGVSVVGAGRDVTVITSTADLPGTGCIVRPGSDAVISDLTIWGTLTNGLSQGCLGYFIRSGLTQPAFTNAEARRLRLIADTDGIYTNNQLSATHVSSLRCYDVLIEAKYDCVFNTWGAGVVDLYDCHLRSIGPSASGDGIAGGIASRVSGIQTTSTPLVRMFGGSIDVQGGTSQNNGVECNMTAGRVELHGVSIRTSGTTPLDIKQVLGTVQVANVSYDQLKVSGTVTIIPTSSTVLANAAHGGTAATLRLSSSTSTPALYVTSSAGDAVKFESTSGGDGLALQGGTSGTGLRSTGGSTGHGVIFIRGSASRDDFVLQNSDAPTFADSMLDRADGVEAGVTMRQALRAKGSALGGDVTDGGSKYKALGNTGTTRLTVVDGGGGNRTVTPTL